jgi:hypothetical protein
MLQYRISGLVLDSDIPLLLPRAESQETDLVCRLMPARPKDADIEPFDERRGPDGRLWLTVARVCSGFLLRFPDLVDVLVCPDGRRIDIRATGLPEEELGFFLLEDVLPLVLSGLGERIMHAAAVSGPGGAILLLGRSGAGKSTFAAALAQAGFAVLSDDWLRLRRDSDRFWVQPGAPTLRLCRDSAAALWPPGVAGPSRWKHRVLADTDCLSFAAGPSWLSHFYQLAPLPPEGSELVTFSPLNPTEAYRCLLESCYRLDTSDRSRLRWEFTELVALALLPSFRLAYPRDLALLKVVAARLADHAQAVSRR